VIRDFDLLEQINKTAILPEDLQTRLAHKVFITFSFSTLDPGIGKVFEPGAPSPLLRLEALKRSLQHGFRSGVSLMPLLPYITDTGESLENMFSTFSAIGANYIFPSSITLFGTAPSDSKTLVMRAVRKHYPQLEEKYHRFFDASDYMPHYYQEAFSRKTQELCIKYGLKNSIVTD
jgi:DNA repair photolyase